MTALHIFCSWPCAVVEAVELVKIDVVVGVIVAARMKRWGEKVGKERFEARDGDSAVNKAFDK
jgi:hypothetical protein